MKSDTEDLDITLSVMKAAARFPNCKIANCECNSNHGEWIKGCNCMCHFFQMDAIYGKNNWSLKEFNREDRERSRRRRAQKTHKKG